MVRTPLGETFRDFIGEIAVWAVICLVGGVFVQPSPMREPA